LWHAFLRVALAQHLEAADTSVLRTIKRRHHFLLLASAILAVLVMAMTFKARKAAGLGRRSAFSPRAVVSSSLCTGG
jgi:hypothetical protein